MHKLGWLAAAVLAGTLSLNAQAQSGGYPVKPVKLIVGFAPGGAADYVARSAGDALARALGQPVIIAQGPASQPRLRPNPHRMATPCSSQARAASR